MASDGNPAGGPPKSTDSATINGWAITITVDTADVAKSLTLSDADAILIRVTSAFDIYDGHGTSLAGSDGFRKADRQTGGKDD